MLEARVKDLLSCLRAKRLDLTQMHNRYKAKLSRIYVQAEDYAFASLLERAAIELTALQQQTDNTRRDANVDAVHRELVRLLRVRYLIRTKQHPLYD